MSVVDFSREMEKRKGKEEKRKRLKIIYLNIIILAQYSTSSERCPKITENREYYLET